VAERAGIVQPAKEKVQGESYQCILKLTGGRKGDGDKLVFSISKCNNRIALTKKKQPKTLFFRVNLH